MRELCGAGRVHADFAGGAGFGGFDERCVATLGIATPTSRNVTRLRVTPGDALWVVAAPFMALAIRDPRLIALSVIDDLTSPPFMFAIIAIAAGFVSVLATRLSDGLGRHFSVHDLVAIAFAVSISVALTSVSMFTVTRLDGVPRSTPLIYAMVLGGGLVLSRALQRAIAFRPVDHANVVTPELLRNIVIVGADRFASGAIKLLSSQEPQTARVIALLDDRPDMQGRALGGVKIAGTAQHLELLLEEYKIHGIEIDQVLVSDDSAGASEVEQEELARVCQRMEVEFATLAEAFNLRPKVVLTAARSTERPVSFQPSAYFDIKRVIDVLAAVLLLALLALPSIIVAVLILTDVGSPVLFWQERVGRNGRRFLLYKFRTYRAPFNWRGESVSEEERLSRIGRFIRKTRLDEIPQLLNILVGDMSLIGPRPLLPRDQPKDPTIRLLVRPGITGWAQVNGGNLVTPEEKDALDSWYVRHASPMVDLKIIAHTLIIASVGERLDRYALADALKWQRNFVSDCVEEAESTSSAHKP